MLTYSNRGSKRTKSIPQSLNHPRRMSVEPFARELRYRTYAIHWSIRYKRKRDI
nr:MAG TPA: hypothetical protein [Caudoviricetes sp.]